MATIRRFKKHFLVYFFTALLTVFSSLAVVNREAIAKQLDSWQVLPRTQGVTELYFADDKQLPTSVRVESTQSVVFVVHNVEHETITYHYKLVGAEEDSTTSQVLASGIVQLDHDQSKAISETVKIPAVTASRMAIQIELEHEDGLFDGNPLGMPHQTIRYWVNVVGHKV